MAAAGHDTPQQEAASTSPSTPSDPRVQPGNEMDCFLARYIPQDLQPVPWERPPTNGPAWPHTRKMVAVSSSHEAAVAFDLVDDRIGGCSLREAIISLVDIAKADWNTIGLFGFSARNELELWKDSRIVMTILVLVQPLTMEQSQAARLVEQILRILDR